MNGGQIASEGAESFAAADCADSLRGLRSFRIEEITGQITKMIHPIHLLRLRYLHGFRSLFIKDFRRLIYVNNLSLPLSY